MVATLSVTSWEGDIERVIIEEVHRFKQSHSRIMSMKTTGNIDCDVEIVAAYALSLIGLGVSLYFI